MNLSALPRVGVCTLFPALVLIGCSSSGAPEPPTAPLDAAVVIAESAAAMGATDLTSITYAGTAWSIRNSFGQTPNASPPWPYRDTYTNYVRTLDLAQPASLATADTFAQNLFLAPPVAGRYVQHVPADRTDWAQQLEVWLTPWGFLEGARVNGAEATTQTVDEVAYTVLTWTSPATQTAPSGLPYTVRGYINARNLIDRVETWVEDPFMGDLHVVGVYGDYRDVGGGVMVPATIEQQRAGGGVFGVTVESAAKNPSNLAALMTPPEVRRGPVGGGGGAQPPDNPIQPIADGVYLVVGGYVALVAEFADHVLVFEGGQSEARGQRIIDEVRRVSAGKPIRYVVNSHPHADHTAGLVPFVREGATIVTHANNVDFLNRALSTPRTLLGEATLTPTFAGVDGVTVYEDATRRVELHHVPNRHSDGTLVAYLPNEKVLFQADFTLPLGGAAPNPFVVELAQYVDGAGLDFDRYLAVHAAREPQTKADLMAAIGK